MNPISPLTSSTSPSVSASRSGDASSQEEAARQFESVLVRQFVEVMTKDLFDTEAEGMLTGQADLQRDTLTDTLTDHLVESGTFGVADLMIQQWKDAGRIPTDADELAPLATPQTNVGGGPSPFDTVSTQGRPPFIDNPSDIQP